jgi:PhzF family phenazine biosynthesis protein
MRLPQYQVDAFTTQPFFGNPAAVVVLENWLPVPLMQSIAAENNLSETAFIVHSKEEYSIRWFTPVTEVSLCGHATLAAAFVVFHFLKAGSSHVIFKSASGPLTVMREEDGLVLDFPSRPTTPIETPQGLSSAIGAPVLETRKSLDCILVVVESEAIIQSLKPNFSLLSQLDFRGVLVTAKGNSADFVSRCFFPNEGILEDPVTGSAHCSLVPYWSEIFGRKSFYAKQLSTRGGELWCELNGDRVLIKGQAVLVMESTLII